MLLSKADNPGGRKLAEWRRCERLTQAAFGAGIGVSKIAVSRYERGDRCPTDDLKLKIWIYTRGAIEPNDWFDLDPAQLGGDGAEAPDPMEAAA